MLSHLVPIIGLLVVFGVPCAIIITFTVLKHCQNMELVRQGINPTETDQRYPGNKPLLWGMILMGLGGAAIVSALIDTDHDFMPIGMLSLGAGIALLVYWKVSEPDHKRAIQLYDERLLTNRNVSADNGVDKSEHMTEQIEGETILKSDI